MLAFYTDCRARHSHEDAVRFTARKFNVKPLEVCKVLNLDASFLIRASWT